MASKVPALFYQAIGIALLIAIVGGFIFGIARLIRLFIKFIKVNQTKSIAYLSLMIICILIAFASWILNFGWFRLILTFYGISIVFTVLFVMSNSKAASHISESKKLQVYTVITYVTYLCAYLFLPDGGDVGPMYVFFSLIQSNTIAYISFFLFIISFGAYIVFTILQFKEVDKINEDRQ